MLHELLRKKFAIGEMYFVNEFETEVLIYEIFSQNTYLLNFLSLNPGAIIFDIGANIGIFSLFAMKHCHYDAEIYCFEPVPVNFSCLQKNMDRNMEGFKNRIHLYPTGISDVTEDREAEFTLFGNSLATATYRPKDKIISNFQPLLDYNTLLKTLPYHNKFLYYQLKLFPCLRKYLIHRNYKKQTRETKIQCRLASLGNFIETHQINHIDFLKIDVEGAEMDVLNSIKPHQFPLIKQISMEVHDIENRVEIIESYLQKLDYLTLVARNPVFDDPAFNHHMIYAKRRSLPHQHSQAQIQCIWTAC